MTYKCGKCGSLAESVGDGFVRCSVCAYKVLYKMRQPVAKTVPAQ